MYKGDEKCTGVLVRKPVKIVAIKLFCRMTQVHVVTSRRKFYLYNVV
jgi:hypothetical protein